MEKDKEDQESTECFLEEDEELSRKQNKLEDKEAERNVIKEMLKKRRIECLSRN